MLWSRILAILKADQNSKGVNLLVLFTQLVSGEARSVWHENSALGSHWGTWKNWGSEESHMFIVVSYCPISLSLKGHTFSLAGENTLFNLTLFQVLREVNKGLLIFLRVYLSKILFESGSIQSRSRKSSAKWETFIATSKFFLSRW